MIEGDRTFGYTLTCDCCGEDCDELFDDFMDAVEFKKDKDNLWHSRKNNEGEWEDICPSCWEAERGREDQDDKELPY